MDIIIPMMIHGQIPTAITTIEGTGYYPQATINFLIGATVKF